MEQRLAIITQIQTSLSDLLLMSHRDRASESPVQIAAVRQFLSEAIDTQDPSAAVEKIIQVANFLANKGERLRELRETSRALSERQTARELEIARLEQEIQAGQATIDKLIPTGALSRALRAIPILLARHEIREANDKLEQHRKQQAKIRSEQQRDLNESAPASRELAELEALKAQVQDLTAKLVEQLATSLCQEYSALQVDLSQDTTFHQSWDQARLALELEPIVAQGVRQGTFSEELGLKYVDEVRKLMADTQENDAARTDLAAQRDERNELFNTIERADYHLGLYYIRRELCRSDSRASYRAATDLLVATKAEREIRAILAIGREHQASAPDPNALQIFRSSLIAAANLDPATYSTSQIILAAHHQGIIRALGACAEVEALTAHNFLGHFEKRIAELTLCHVLPRHESKDETVTLGYMLLRYQRPENIPFVLMNCWREPGHSGEEPFLSRSDPDLGRCPVFNYVQAMNGDAVKAIKDTNVPGLAELFDIVREAKAQSDFRLPTMFHPDVQRFIDGYAAGRGVSAQQATRVLSDLREARDEDRLRSCCEVAGVEPESLKKMVFAESWDATQVPNPTFEKANQALAKMALHYIEFGSPNEKLFALGLFKGLPCDLSQHYPKIAELLRGSETERVREALAQRIVERAKRIDPSCLLILLDQYAELPQQTRWAIDLQRASILTEALKLKLNDHQIAALAKISDKNPEDLKLLCDFVGLLEQSRDLSTIWVRHESVTLANYDNFLTVARLDGVKEALAKLQTLGYEFNSQHVVVMPQLISAAEQIDLHGKKIRSDFPGYRYSLRCEFSAGQPVYTVGDPYVNFFDQHGLCGVAATLRELLKKYPAQCPKEYLLALGCPHDQQALEAFDAALRLLLAETSNVGKLGELAEHLFSEDSIKALAKSPNKLNEILDLGTNQPHLMSLLQPGAVLYPLSSHIIVSLLRSADLPQFAAQLESNFTTDQPYWKQLFRLARMKIAAALEISDTTYPVATIGSVSVDSLFNSARRGRFFSPQATLDERGRVALSDLTPLGKTFAIRGLLRQVIETSRNEAVKKLADLRNRSSVQAKLEIAPGAFIHGSAIEHLAAIISDGNLSGELLGLEAKTDSYPFQVDFSRITNADLVAQPAVSRLLEATLSSSYGKNGAMGPRGQVYHIYDRRQASWEPGVDFTSGNEHHGLLLAGIPGTETTALVLKDPEATIEEAIQGILEAGFYIPVYSMEGALIFSPERYDELSQDRNFHLAVSRIDNSMRIGPALGSNAGGTFLVGTQQGPQKCYVKTASAAQADKLWNEQLADNFYRALSIPVPLTGIVKLEGCYGHSSRILEGAQPGRGADFKHGFLADCLLCNWDIVANAGNTLLLDGVTYRIDNGGALLYRARGERRELDGLVSELSSMRPCYPDLSEADLQQQAKIIQERLTDQCIDSLVHAVRMPLADRELIAATLKTRRDVIISTVLDGRETVTTQQQAALQREFQMILQSQNLLQSPRLSELVPGWNRLIGPQGYQHNGESLGLHTSNVVSVLRSSEEFAKLSAAERELALIAAFFHDFGKPTGEQGQAVARDREHEVGSMRHAVQFMTRLGYAKRDIDTVATVINFDGVVSDICRGKVQSTAKILTPQQLATQLKTSSTCKILMAVNRADAISAAGLPAYRAIEASFKAFFARVGVFLAKGSE